MAEKIARYYVQENNPNGGHFPGVGLRDLTEEEWNALPEDVQKSVDASSMYRKTKPEGWEAAPAYESGIMPKEKGGAPARVSPPIATPVVVPEQVAAPPTNEGGK